MGLIIILVVGAIVGWLAGMLMRSGGGILFDIVVGIVGALIAGFLFGGGASIINAPLNLMSFLYSLIRRNNPAGCCEAFSPRDMIPVVRCPRLTFHLQPVTTRQAV